MIRNERGEKTRLAIALVGFLLAFGALALRAMQLQLGMDERVAKVRNRETSDQVVLSPPRGTIYDTKDRVLAVNYKAISVFADPQMIDDPKRFSKLVSPILSMSYAEVLKKIRNPSKRFVWLKRKLDPAVEDKIEHLDLSGVHFVSEGTRLYPDRQLASQIIGFVGVDGDGLGGLERYYDRFLRSQNLVVKAQKDARGRAIFSKDAVMMEPEPGADLHLTIDAVIQHAVERELKAATEESGAPRSMGIVMDPNTGEILAMASYPTLDPNRMEKVTPEQFKNRPVEDVYEPGSTFKIFTLAAALESGAIKPSDRVYCKKGSLTLHGKTIRTHEPHEWLLPSEVLKFSDNIGSSRIALRVGSERMKENLKKFGFGQESGIDLPQEPRGLMSVTRRWSDLDLANISFGQGIGVTAIQLLSALASVANGGFRVRPFLVKKVQFTDGRELSPQKPQGREQILSERTSKLLRTWMTGVTENGGTGVKALVPGYSTAGKTGTTQKIDPLTGKYSPKHVVSSFVGFVPASQPQLVAMFVFDDPKTFDFGGTLAAPVFRKVMEEALSYLHIPPDRPLENQTPLPELKLAEVRKPAELEKVDADKNDVVPDVRGLTIREVLSKSKELPCDVRIIGSGIAVRQEPAPGLQITNVKRISVYFEPNKRIGGAT